MVVYALAMKEDDADNDYALLDPDLKRRAKRFFDQELLSHHISELDIFALWPPETQDPPYMWNLEPPRNYTYEGELLWLVPMDNNVDIHITARGQPYPNFKETYDTDYGAQDPIASQKIRYIGTLHNGNLILLGSMNPQDKTYHIPYTTTLTINFEEPNDADDTYIEGKWAYYPLPEYLRTQSGPINYTSDQILNLLSS